MSATQGTPRRCSARPTACADSGGEVVSTQSKRSRRWAASAARRANGAQATRERLRHDQLAQRVRLAGVAVGVEQRVDPVVAGQPRPPGLQVEGPNHLETPVSGPTSASPPTSSPKALVVSTVTRHPSRARYLAIAAGRCAPGVAGRRVEVGDEQKRTGAAHAGAPSFSCRAAMRLGVGVVHPVEQRGPGPLLLGLAASGGAVALATLGADVDDSVERHRRRRPSRRLGPARRSRSRRSRPAPRGSRSRWPAGRRPSPRSGRSRTTPAARSSARRGRRRAARSGARRAGRDRGSGRGRRRRPRRPRRGSRRAARRRRRRSGGRSRARVRASASIATSRRLKWWARSRVATKAATTASAGIPSSARRPLASGPGEKASVSTPFGISITRSGVFSSALLQVGDRAGVVGAEDEDPVRGADQRRCDGVLVGLEQSPRVRRPSSRFL